MKAEIQLRTIAMDSWASLEHQLRYKKDNEIDEQVAAEIRACADLSAALDEKMNQLKHQMERTAMSEEEKRQQELIRIQCMVESQYSQHKFVNE